MDTYNAADLIISNVLMFLKEAVLLWRGRKHKMYESSTIEVMCQILLATRCRPQSINIFQRGRIT